MKVNFVLISHSFQNDVYDVNCDVYSNNALFVNICSIELNSVTYHTMLPINIKRMKTTYCRELHSSNWTNIYIDENRQQFTLVVIKRVDSEVSYFHCLTVVGLFSKMFSSQHSMTLTVSKSNIFLGDYTFISMKFWYFVCLMVTKYECY